MKIDFLLYAYEPGLGGEMGGVRKLLGLARGLQQARHAVRVIAPRFLNLKESGVEVVTYPTVWPRLLRPLSAYLAMARGAWRRARRGLCSLAGKRPEHLRAEASILRLALRGVRR